MRRMIFSLLAFYVLSLVLYMLCFILVGMSGVPGQKNKILLTPRYRGLQEMYNSVILFSMTVLMLNTLLNFRTHLQATFYYHYTSSNSEKGLNWLKLRTLQIEGKTIPIYPLAL